MVQILQLLLLRLQPQPLLNKFMQLYPKPVTHHHVHRLYHMSVGFCFAFAALAMVGTMGTVWMNAGAEDVQVTATVAGVTPGPQDPNGGSAYVPPPQQTANPTITIVAEPRGQIPVQTGRYVFEIDRPSFSGTTSVPNGLVFITIRGASELNSTTRAGANGNWFWQSPVSLVNGNYTIRVAVFDSYDLTRSGFAEANFTVNSRIPQPPSTPPTSPPGTTPPTPGSPSIPGEPQTPPIVLPPNLLFGVFFNVFDQYKTVTVGQKIIGQVTLLSNSDDEISNQDIHYKVYGPDKNVVLDTTDTVSFSKKAQIQKTFFTAPRTPAGEYTIEVSSKYLGVTSVASDTFRLVEPVSGGGTTTVSPPLKNSNIVIMWILMILLLLLFIVLAILAYRHMRHHTQQLQNQPA